MQQQITPHLWFTANNAQEAMQYYVSVFPNSRIVDITYYPDNGDQIDQHLAHMEGKVLTGVFELNGQQFLCIDGGEQGFTFNNAISFMVTCKDQTEIDYFWSKLSAKPEAEQCGWCIDKFGLSWQIVPQSMDTLLQSPAQIQTLMTMKKIVIQDLIHAGA